MVKETRLLMGMPITVAVVDEEVPPDDVDRVFAFFAQVDDALSTYKPESEISRLNRGELTEAQCSEAVRTVLALSEQTRRETGGYFDIRRDGIRDPSGLVKGWAILRAANLLHATGYRDYFVDAGGDAQVCGTNDGQPWRVGIRNPFNRREHVKVVALRDEGIATSGTAIRGQHIYNPHEPAQPLRDIVSITVIGPDVYEADRFATAAFAMGRAGIRFISGLAGFEGYMIDANGQATYTTGFERYVPRL